MMQGYNAILVYDASGEQILFCYRMKEPYKGKYNFVGGKIEQAEDGSKEDGFVSAYRELFEETGISREDIELFHLMDLTYHSREFYLEIYVGQLRSSVELQEEKNPLCWLSKNEDFFDTERFAGDGNMGHIVRISMQYGFGVAESREDSKIVENEYLKIESKYVGVDGCKGGWIAAILDADGLKIEKYEKIDKLIECHRDFRECLVDMVIGLPEKQEDVRPEAAARKIIPKRASTIFPVPCRQAVYAESTAEKYELNEKIMGKKFTPLTMGIIPKMKEMDEFFHNHSQYKNTLRESHPEVCFSRLQGKTIMTKKSTEEGIVHRISILSNYIKIDRNYLERKQGEYHCGMDDILDAICLTVTGVLVDQGKYEVIPDKPMKDKRGLYMQMVIPK